MEVIFLKISVMDRGPPKPLFFCVFCWVLLVFFFSYYFYGIIESSYWILWRSCGLRRLTISLFSFFILPKLFQKRIISPSQCVGTGGWKTKVGGEERETSRAYEPERLFLDLTAFALKAYKNKSWMLNGGRKLRLPVPIQHSWC